MRGNMLKNSIHIQLFLGEFWFHRALILFGLINVIDLSRDFCDSQLTHTPRRGLS